MLCPSCSSEISDSAKFCPKCGAVRTATIPTPADTKRCPKCGTENLIEAKFCKKDGYRFEHPEESAPLRQASPAVPRPVSPEQSRPAAVPPPRPAPAPPPQPALRQAEAPARERNPWKWAVAAMILVLVGAGGAGAYLYHTGAFISPVELNANISSAFLAKGIQGVAVNVGDDRVAKLSGIADDAATKYEAVQVARSVKGVKDVFENLEVLPTIADTEMRLSKTLKDQKLTDILVKIDPKRTVTLIGNVTVPAMIEVATKAATATPGVKSVVSQIQVVEMLPSIQSVEPQPRTVEHFAPRFRTPSRARSAVTLGERMSAPVPAVPVRPMERRHATCDGLGGLYLFSCNIEGPEQYFRCAPDGRQWNNAIPGCDRSGSRN